VKHSPAAEEVTEMNTTLLYLNALQKILDSKVTMNGELEALYSRIGENDVANLYLAKRHCFEDAVEAVKSLINSASALDPTMQELKY
jgi:hypothetical protein